MFRMDSFAAVKRKVELLHERIHGVVSGKHVAGNHSEAFDRGVRFQTAHEPGGKAAAAHVVAYDDPEFGLVLKDPNVPAGDGRETSVFVLNGPSAFSFVVHSNERGDALFGESGGRVKAQVKAALRKILNEASELCVVRCSDGPHDESILKRDPLLGGWTNDGRPEPSSRFAANVEARFFAVGKRDAEEFRDA